MLKKKKKPEAAFVVGVYRVSVGKVELSGVFEDEMLTPFPLWVLIFQIDSESFHVFDPCGDTAAATASASAAAAALAAAASAAAASAAAALAAAALAAAAASAGTVPLSSHTLTSHQITSGGVKNPTAAGFLSTRMGVHLSPGGTHSY